jgi:hypothetical protein
MNDVAQFRCSELHSDGRLRKRIVRTLIHEVVVDVDAQAGEIILIIHWKGGVHTELRLPRRRRGQNSSQTSKDVIEAVRVLARICSDDVLAIGYEAPSRVPASSDCRARSPDHSG